jgi:hypothetical protein
LADSRRTIEKRKTKDARDAANDTSLSVRRSEPTKPLPRAER